jgi:hypothetical protein
VKALQERTILLKLLPHADWLFEEVISLTKEQIMSNRVLNRVGARELTPAEAEYVVGAGSTGTGCVGTSLHPHGPIIDQKCDIDL